MTHVITLALLYSSIIILLFVMDRAHRRVRLILTGLCIDVMSGDKKPHSQEFNTEVQKTGLQVLLAWLASILLVIVAVGAGYFTALYH